MPIQVVMDHTGDTRHEFAVDDSKAVAEAMARFNELTTNGYTAFKRDPARREVAVLQRTFDPNAEEVAFFPRLIGG